MSIKTATADVSHAPQPPLPARVPLRRLYEANKTTILATASVVGGLALWEGAARWIIQDKLFLVAPSEMMVRLAQLWQTGEIQQHTLTSGAEFLIGFAVASIVGVLGGLALGVSPVARALATPWVSAFNSTPTVALSPLLILWFGIGLSSKVVVVFIVSVFSVLVNTQAGIEGADERLVETARAFGARRSQIFIKVLLPSAVPFIVAGLRLGVGRALVGVVVAELFGATSGLGFLITTSSQVFDMGALFAAVTILAGAGVASTELIRVVEKRLAPWREG
jgi:ABC-type nitrate/sulfonate/bicarbonate transport system permease component